MHVPARGLDCWNEAALSDSPSVDVQNVQACKMKFDKSQKRFVSHFKASQISWCNLKRLQSKSTNDNVYKDYLL